MICPVPRASEVRSNVVMTRVIGVRMGVAVDIRTIIDYKKYSLSESIKYYFKKKSNAKKNK